MAVSMASPFLTFAVHFSSNSRRGSIHHEWCHDKTSRVDKFFIDCLFNWLKIHSQSHTSLHPSRLSKISGVKGGSSQHPKEKASRRYKKEPTDDDSSSSQFWQFGIIFLK
jgi:hypothetical protein